ncbi:hypothetical protein GCM10009430_02920 [Aquimarina litoralis]|uniref:DNA alkylation repair enzyme n=1 Tax=Aquimarina litoralis TaxID=584605 RepID=A0ABP3TMA3_9FLAO
MYKFYRHSNNQFVKEGILILEEAGAVQDTSGKIIHKKLSRTLFSPRKTLVVKVLRWLCEQEKETLVRKTLALGLLLAQTIKEQDRHYYDEVFALLFDRCHTIINQDKENVFLLARILGDMGDDHFDWEYAEKWYSKIAVHLSPKDIKENQIGLRSILSCALRGLSGLAMRKNNLELAWQYAMKDYELYSKMQKTHGQDILFCLKNLLQIAKKTGSIQKANEIKSQIDNLQKNPDDEDL